MHVVNFMLFACFLQGVAITDLLDLTPITQAMFLCDKPSLETTYLDMLDGNYVRKRRRFGVKMMKELRECFRREYLGQSVQGHLQDPQPSNI
ncbi:hypothetical protein TNCV_4343601 [Trichonephila clavipes]|nr:hypothetical protein TNCV_4343601 [Trichonephila clavipes]